MLDKHDKKYWTKKGCVRALSGCPDLLRFIPMHGPATTRTLLEIRFVNGLSPYQNGGYLKGIVSSIGTATQRSRSKAPQLPSPLILHPQWIGTELLVLHNFTSTQKTSKPNFSGEATRCKLQTLQKRLPQVLV